MFGVLGLRTESFVRLHSKSLPPAFTDTRMGFVNVSDLEILPAFTPSAAFVYTQSPNTTICLIKAHWVDFNVIGFTPGKAFLNLVWEWDKPHPDWFLEGPNWFNQGHPSQVIQLDLEWLAALDNGTGGDRDYSFLERLRQTCLDQLEPGDNPTKSSEKELSTACMSVGLAAGITEGLSKVPYSLDIHLLVPDEDLKLLDNLSYGAYGEVGPSLTLSSWMDVIKHRTVHDDWIFDENWTSPTLSPSEIRRTSTRLDFVVTEVLYGYGFHSVTTILAFVVLFLYVATVFVHILIMIFGTRWSSRAWKSVGQLLVLAMRSPPPPPVVLDNTGGGVESLSTWRSRIFVRETQDGKMVDMMIEETGTSGANNGLASSVRADWKYS